MSDITKSSSWEGGEYWNWRVKEFGHTGWAHPILYKYDQKVRGSLIAKLVQVEHPVAILDFGCGTGDMVEALARGYPQSKIMGIDISDKVIEVAKQRLNVLGNVALRSGSIDSVVGDAGGYDLILCITVLQHIEVDKLPYVLQRIESLLRPNGRIIILENIYKRTQVSNYINTSFGEYEWLEVLLSAGLKIEQVTSYPHWGVLAVETVLPFLRNLREGFRNRKKWFSPNVIPAEAKLARVSPSGRITSLLIKFILVLAWPLDHFFKVVPPKFLRHYSVFVMSKK